MNTENTRKTGDSPKLGLALGSAAWLRSQADELDALGALEEEGERETKREILGLRDAATHIDNLSAALGAILDAVDYTTGNCRTNDMVSAALDRVLITNARKVLSGLRNNKVTHGGSAPLGLTTG
jgi:hypothetical protein